MTSDRKLQFECQLSAASFRHINEQCMWCDSCQKKVHDFRTASFDEYQRVYESHAGDICGIYLSDENQRVFFIHKPKPISFLKAAALTIMICFNTDLFSMSPDAQMSFAELKHEWLLNTPHHDSVDVRMRIKLDRRRLKNAAVLVRVNDQDEFQEIPTDHRGNLILRLNQDEVIKSVEIKLSSSGSPIHFSYKETAQIISKKPILVDIVSRHTRGKF